MDGDPNHREETAAVLEASDGTDSSDDGETNNRQLTVLAASDVSGGLERLETRDVDCIVSDDELPDGDVVEFLDAVREDYPDVPFVLYTDTNAEDVVPEAFDAGVDDYVQRGDGPATAVLLRNRVRDAVDLYRATQTVAQTERRYRKLIEESTDVIAVVDENGQYVYLSPAVEPVWGYTPDELIGETGFEYVHPDDREHVQELFADVVADPDRSAAAEFRVKRPDGTWQWTEGRARNLLDEDVVGGVVVYSRDISEHKRRERELREERAIVHGIIETIPDIVFAFDETGDPLRDDLILSDIPGYTEDELREKHPLEFVRPADRETLGEAIARILDEGTVEAYDTALIMGSGEEVPHRVVASRLTDEAGRVLGVVGTAHDISERVERERELERQIERLDEFADLLSHDLRNPLTVAKGRLELAREEPESEHFAAVANAHDRMEEMVEELLELAREGEVTRELIELADITGSCWGNVRTPDATLRMETDGAVRADKRRLRQLFENLFRNAVEHADEDVTVTVSELETDEGFYVADDGPGIPGDRHDELFESGVSTKPDGTGFGLYIVDQVAADHGWSVRACDSDAGGARFEVTGVDIKS